MELGLRTAMSVALAFALSIFAGAQTPAQIGNVYVGICDGALQNTQQNEVDVYDATGQFVNAFHGPSQNTCLTAMTFDAGDHSHIISARFGTASWNVLEFDNLGTLLSTRGPFNTPSGIAHDLQGGIYLAQGNVLKIDHSNLQTTFNVAGGAVSLDLAPDQRTLFYTALNGDVKSYDVVSKTQGPDIAVNALARSVRVLPDNSILIDSLGAIQKWSGCAGCPYKRKTTYQVPANADSFSLDPDGVSFWSINTFYDDLNQLGNADVYRTNIKTGEPMGNFSLQALTNGRFYSMSIGVNGDGMSSSASVTPSITFPARIVGTVSNPKKAVLTNIGVIEVVVTKLTITGDFAILKNGCTKGVLAGGSCNISLTFTPTQTGTRTGTLKIFDNATNSPQTVTLTGVGK